MNIEPPGDIGGMVNYGPGPVEQLVGRVVLVIFVLLIVAVLAWF